MMNFVGLRTLAVVIVGYAAAAALLADARAVDVRNCTWCHGTSGQGDSIAPRLAGQRMQYIENQLVRFVEHTRDNPFSAQYMWGAVVALGPHDRRFLASYFSMLPAKAANDGKHELASIGKAIYEDGVAESNVAACTACHGPNGEGIRDIPRLGGLSYHYLNRALKQWGAGYHAAAGPVMPRIARKLSPDMIDAVASYLSFVK